MQKAHAGLVAGHIGPAQGRRQARQKAARTMKIPPPSMKLREPNPASPYTPADTGTGKPVAMPLPATEVEEKFLPFGAAAKAIFVKANGLPAYYKSIRSLRYAR